MTKRIFRSVFLASLLVFLAGLALVVGTMYNYFSVRQAGQLHIEARLAANGVERAGLEYLETVDDGEVRLTWIAEDGTVIYDTDAEAGEMENHAEREEFREALRYGTGEGERTSSTLSEKTVYYAIRLSDGSVLRTAESHYTLPALLMGIIQPLVLILVLALLLSGWLASRLSKRIVGPLNAIDLDKPLENDAYDELSPLLTRVERQQRQISGQLEELRRRKEEFAAITDSMSEGLILIDSRGTVMSVNPSARKIFGADASSEGRDVLTVDRSPELRTLLEKSAGGGRAECCISRGEREYLLTASPVVTGGERQGTVLLAVDVTEKQRAERLRREFTANVSHELKTPLHSIMGSAELLQDGLVRPEDRDRFLGRIRSEAARLVQLVQDVIDLSRLDEGEEFPREDADLMAMAREVAASLADEAERRKVALTVSGEGGTVRGVRRLLWEIIWNLAENAVKYSRPEGGRADIGVSTLPDGRVRLTVSDDGVGIPPEAQSRVFERFYRVDKSHSRETGGTGLGLSIVKHAAQYHGAEVELESEPGKGTTISVTFQKRAD